MQAVYWFALIVGGGMLLVSLIGDFFGDHGGDVGIGGHDADLGLGGHDVDIVGDAGVDGELSDVTAGAHGAAAGHASAHDMQAARILSLRTITYFLFGFGAVGLVLAHSGLDAHPFVDVAASALGGVLAAAVSVITFGYVRSTEAGEREDESSFVGLPARVVLPVGAARSGRILVRRGEREYELRAKPFGSEDVSSEGWKQVVIVEMREGTALVSPFDSPIE